MLTILRNNLILTKDKNRVSKCNDSLSPSKMLPTILSEADDNYPVVYLFDSSIGEIYE